MCGIAGLYRLGGVADPKRAQAMVRSLAHRGPDDEAMERWGQPPWVVLGARRLALVDPAGGQQPGRDATGRIRVFLNGEIYNHSALRAELRSNDVPIRTASDTEVVAHLVALQGIPSALSRLQGMFSLAILDVEAQQLTLVRDRMGVKPLYWRTLADGTLAWASELRALHGLGALQRRTEALQAFLLQEMIPTPWTPWQGVFKLEPGCFLQIDRQGMRQSRWWTPPVPRGPAPADLDRWASSLHGALQVAVKQRLQADYEVGLLLSGGLDSSAITALAQAQSDRPLRSFSISVDAPGFDEGPEARRVAASLGTQHQEARLGAEDLPRLLDAITEHMDEPLADSSLIATWRLMELVREAGLRCVLSGDGADESFAGYPTTLAHGLADLAAPFAGLLGPLTRRLPTRWEGVTPDYMARRFVDGLSHPWARRHAIWMGAWLPEELGAAEAVWEQVDAHAQAAAGADPVSRCLYLDQRLYLADGVLVKMDRASMAHGIEVRSPFLDHSIVTLAADMPVQMKLLGRQRKRVLKRAMAGMLPTETLQRRKQGFGTPIGPWLRGPAKGLLRDLPEQVDDLIPGDRLRAVIAEHAAGVADHRRRLWSALILARWRRGPWGE